MPDRRIVQSQSEGSNLFSWSPQDGPPGHCFVAQVFGPNGNSVASFDATIDPAIASRRAMITSIALNMELLTGSEGAAPIIEKEEPTDDN